MAVFTIFALLVGTAVTQAEHVKPLACDRQTEVKVATTEASAGQRADGWACITRQECDPIFQFTAISTELQHVCTDYPRMDYVLQFDKDISKMMDAADWQDYFDRQSQASEFADDANFNQASAVHVHSCQTEHVAESKWNAYCSIHFEPKAGESKVDAGRTAALKDRAWTHAKRQRRGFGNLDNAGLTTALPAGQRTCANDSSKYCCKVGWGVESGNCVECDATGTEPAYSDTDVYSITQGSNPAAQCQPHPTCTDNEGTRWGFYDSDGTMTGTVLSGTDEIDRFGDDHYFLTNMARAVCRTQTSCRSDDKVLDTATTEWLDAVCGETIVYCTSAEWWTNSDDAQFQEPEWDNSPTCGTLATCLHTQRWTNSMEMNSFDMNKKQYKADRVCATRAGCDATEYLNNFDDVRAAKDTAGDWKTNNVAANDCQQLTTCSATTQFVIAQPQVRQLGWGEKCSETDCGGNTDTTKCGEQNCYGCEKCYGEGVAISQRYCGTASAPCGTTEFEEVMLTATSNRRCTPWEVCEFDVNNEYEIRAPNATHDRVCTLTTLCDPSSEFMALESTEFADRDCDPLTVCDETQVETTMPTDTTDRNCTTRPPPAPVNANIGFDDPAVAGICADQAFPAYAPNDEEGWYFKNTVTTDPNRKINWYFVGDKTRTVRNTLGDIDWIMARLKAYSVDSLPWFSIYTQTEGDVDGVEDAATWYRSRQSWVIDGSPSADETFVMYHGTDQPDVDGNLTHYGTKKAGKGRGPQADSEKILYLAFSTNSAAALNSVEFSLTKFIHSFAGDVIQLNTIKPAAYITPFVATPDIPP